MTRAERNKIIKWADTLTDEELEKTILCYDCGIKLWGEYHEQSKN